jgi:hypothetical protein
MGTFRTKLDFSDNRQVKQRIETTTNLSGATTFGVPFGNLPTGPNPALSSITQSISNILGTFSGNSGTTVFTWTDSRFNLGNSTFSAITPSNSGVTQNSGNVFTPVTSSLFTVDGNTGYTQYSGVSFTMYPTTFIGLGGGAYSGQLATYVSQILGATGLDFTGRTIWNDVSGITRTNRLIITDNPMSGYVWTCIDSEGMGEWQYNGSSSGSTIWTAGTGVNSAVLGGSNGIASGSTSVAEGVNTKAGGIASHAEGGGTQALGDLSHAEGEDTIASNTAAHAEGVNTIASGVYSHAEGSNTIASNSRSHAEGYLSIASGVVSHAEGESTLASGGNSHAEGSSTIASGANSHAEGFTAIASGNTSHAEGSKTLASGYVSHAEGSGTTASGQYSHAEGFATIASGDSSHAEGSGTTASGQYSHAEGYFTTASGDSSHAEGHYTIAGGYASHAQGSGTIASGDYSHAEGFSDSYGTTIASGDYSHAEGWGTLASGDASHAQGYVTIASGDSSHAGGNQSKVYSDNGFIHASLSKIDLNSNSSAILGGYFNIIDKSTNSGIFAGKDNTISGGTIGNTNNIILGGDYNKINNHAFSTIINGSGNTIHFDLADFNYPYALEMIENSKDSIISASTMSKISSSESMTIAKSILSTVISSAAGNFDPDPYLTSGGIIGTDDPNDNGTNTIIGTYEGLIRYKGASNTIIGSVVSRIDGTAAGVGGGANVNFIGNSSSVTISDQYNTSGFSSYNTIFGSYASSILAPNKHSNIMGSEYVGIEFSDYTSIISSIDSEILTGITSSIIGGTGHTLTTTENSMILGGALNTIDTSNYSIIAGGSGNTVTKNTDNLTQPKYSGIFAGKNNKIIPKFGSGVAVMSGSYCAIVGGESNTISGHSHSFIGGGFNNLIECDAAFNAIVAGQNNINHAFNGVIIGGQDNTLGFSTSCPSQAENSIILGGSGNTIALTSNNTFHTAIIGGKGHIIDNRVDDLENTVIIGGEYITANTSNTVYVPNMIINTGGTQSKLGINTSTPEYVIDANGNNARLVLADTYTGDDLPFKSFVFSANSTNVPQIAAATNSYLGGYGLSLQMGVVGDNSISTATSELIGLSGDTYLSSSQKTNNLNIINRSGSNGTNNIRMYAGVNSVSAASEPDFIIRGSGSTRGYIGIKTGDPQYLIEARGHLNNSLLYDPTFAGNSGTLTMSATTGLPTIGVATNTGVVNQNGGISIGMRAWNDSAWATYGKQGDSHVYSSKQSNGLVIISSDGVGTEDYIECYVGGDADGSGALAIHMHGTGATKGYVGFDTNLPTQRLDVNGNGRFRTIGSSASAGALHYAADGTLTTNTSDERLKTNITTLTGALSKVNQLRGVTYNWTENPTGDTRIGFIAQEVNSIVPELTFTNPNSPEQYMGVHYDNVTALLVEAVKELSSGITTSNNTHLETQTILAEDNNVELNFNGTQQTALGGGLSILHAKGQGLSSDLITDANGNFVTNNDFKPQALTIPLYTPTSSNDTVGSEGNITRDDNYMYVKTSTGWKRTNLENF